MLTFSPLLKRQYKKGQIDEQDSFHDYLVKETGRVLSATVEVQPCFIPG
jgi:hypothetical protein